MVQANLYLEAFTCLGTGEDVRNILESEPGD